MTNRFKDLGLRRIYDSCLSLARDPDSEFYVPPNGIRVGHPDEDIIFSRKGTIANRRTGASHRNYFWQGYNGAKAPHRGTLGYACWRAGQDYRKERNQPQ